MESPRSEKIETRFSTPVSALDDHRAQNATASMNAENNMAVDDNQTRPRIIGPDLNVIDAGPVARDFENAIIDDDEKSNADLTANNLEGFSPSMPRRTLSYRIQPKPDEPPKPRDRSPSDRSVSPPNSIDAFAEPRRRERANTFGSKAPSDLELHRTLSTGTHQRRPTFSNHSLRQSCTVEDAKASRESITYPPEEQTSVPLIDYEAMDEFVAESSRCRPAGVSCKRYSFSSQGHRPGQMQSPSHEMSGIIADSITPLNCQHDSDSTFDGGKKIGEFLHEKLHLGQEPAPRPNAADPNRFTFFSSQMEQTIHAPELGDLTMPDESFRDLFELPSEAGAWWLDVTNPREDELEMFQKAFGLHPLTKEDIEQKEAREKVELFNTYYFVCFRSFENDKKSDDYLEAINLYMIVFRAGILTFTYEPNTHATAVRKRIGKLRNYESLTADWICYAMVDNIIDYFFPVIQSIEKETDQIEDQVFVARVEDFSQLLRQIGECRKKVMSLMRLLGGKADVIKGFAKRCNTQYSVTPRGEIGLYLSDIQDHVVTMMSNLGHFEKMLSRSHSNYLAQLSVDNLVQGNRANEVLGKITFIATVLVPMNLICGLFGMNVPVPGGVTPGSLGMFGGIVGFMVVIVAIAFTIAKRLKYI